MTKDEILAKSREDNQFQDIADLEIKRSSYSAGYAAMVILAAVYTIIQNHTDHAEAYKGVFSVLTAFWFGQSLYAAHRKDRNRTESICRAVFFLVITVMLARKYIMYLIGQAS